MNHITHERTEEAVSATHALLDHDVLVMVGGGAKAHVLRTHPEANLKMFELAEGATVYDIALCGGRGAMTSAAEDTDLCATCSNHLTD